MVLNEVCADGNVLWAALDRGACRIDGGRAVLILKDHYVNHVAATSQGIIIGANDGLYLFRQGRTRKVAEVKAVLCSYDDATAHRLWLGTFHEGAVAVDDRTFSTIASDGLRLPLMPVRAIQPWDATTLFFGVDGAVSTAMT